MSALNIKDAEVAAKARKLARLTGKSITEAVSEALDEKLRATTRGGAAGIEAREREVDAIVARFRRSLKPGSQSPWKIADELYDDRGLPR
jgi:antitoxin VapB